MTLRGNMEPVATETTGDLTLVHGALPTDIDGQFIRNGPNPYFDMYSARGYHEFSGDGMMHAVDLKKGTATYSNRWVQTKKLASDKQRGRAGRMADYIGEDGFQMGTANTALVCHAKQLLALYESDRPYVISAPTLETLGPLTYGGALKHNMTAHPKVCPETGELIFFGYGLTEPKVSYGVVSPDNELVCNLELPTRGGKPVMMHDMAITQNYSVLLEFPLYFEMSQAVKGNMPYVHDTAGPAVFAVLPRHAKAAEDARWFSVQNKYCFHIANSWEEAQTIKIVGCPQDHFSFEYTKRSKSRLYEWTLHLDTGDVSEQELSDCYVEFPVVHPSLTGRRNRYVWAARFTGGSPPFAAVDGCVRYDQVTGELLAHRFVGRRWGGECVFAPREGGRGEDDGYLLTYTYNEEERSSELYIVDARTMSPDPVAILRTPQRVPFGFHGVWVPRGLAQ